ncbi:class D sortase [Niallia taxi]|uniref:class D sortase n=1 Tax=Niallia taxi TaxID=2499688 RepID=UPI00217525FB|nr:class D sortase [Niallia taxi]
MKKWALLTLPILLLGVGAYITVGNTFKFTTGYKMASASTGEHSFLTEKEIQEIKEGEPSTTEGSPSVQSVSYSEKPKTGQNFGDLYIPKLDAVLPIVHGTSEEDLEKGVGHFAGSVLPGENDNSVLAGHRDTVFRKLGEVGINDDLIVKTSAGTFTYKVREVKIVDSDDRTVIVSMPKATLTVSTCYPFTFIGPAPQRYVLIADLVSSK